jgi:membrane fusion protein (multidrug efflux system)
MALSKKGLRIAGVLVLIALGVAGYIVMHLGEVSTDDAAFSATVVTVSPKVAGYVKALNVTDNQAVKAGDTLLEIDSTDYRIALDRAKATLAAAQADLAAAMQNLESTRITAPANPEAAQAAVDAAKADWDNAVKNLKRQQSLTDAARSRAQLEDAVAAEKRTRAALNDAKIKLTAAQVVPQALAAAQAQADQLAAVVRQAEADVAQAQQNLGYTKIVAPIAGRVSNRTVERGDYLQPGQQLMSLVGNDVWVTANFKETQLKNMRAGQPVDIDVDAYPDLELHGKVDSFQSGAGAVFSAFPPQNATGNFVKIVQRVPVKIKIDGTIDSKYVIGPGMSVEPTVHTD